MNAVCPLCGSETPQDYLNVSAIKSATAWTRIELTDEQISKLASGMFEITLTPVKEVAPATEQRSSLVLCVDIERLLSRARTLLDKIFTFDGDDERDRSAVVKELDEVLLAMRGIE